MRTLITLSVLQTIGIILLLVHSFSNPREVAPAQRPEAVSSSSPPHVYHRDEGAASLAGEERLRTIIAEELARLQLQPGTQSNASPAIPARARDEAADRRRQEHIAQQIENYKAAGTITDEQMWELQADIAKLDAASREQLLSRLVRALNSGELKGRL
jgi:hypothetical protein